MPHSSEKCSEAQKLIAATATRFLCYFSPSSFIFIYFCFFFIFFYRHVVQRIVISDLPAVAALSAYPASVTTQTACHQPSRPVPEPLPFPARPAGAHRAPSRQNLPDRNRKQARGLRPTMSSLQALSLSSRRAEDAAATFLLFRDALPAGQEAHVPALVGAHYNLQTALLDLKRTLSDARFAPFADVVARDQRSVLQSIEHTLRDIRRLFAGLAEHDDDIDLDGGGIRGGAGAGSGRGYSRERTHPINGAGAGAGGREAYRRVWRRIGEHFAAEGHGIAGCDSLVARLQCYEAFVRDLIGCVEGRRPGRAFANLQYKVEKLLGRQSKSLEASMDMLAVGRAPTAKQRSWERMRPGRVGGGGRVEGRTEDEFADYELCDDEDGVYSDEYAGGAGAGRAGGRVAVPTEFALDPRLRPDVITPAALGHATYAAGPSYRPAPGLRYSPESGAGLAYDQQFAPDPPGSPGGSTATASSLSSDGGSRDRDADHWVASVFAQARPATAFASTGSESACYGEHMPAAARRLRDGYDQLVRLPFDDGQIEARVLVRHADRRARILVRCERGARRLLSCQPLTSLRVLRRGDGLQLCVPERAHVVLWALLRFPTFERTFWP